MIELHIVKENSLFFYPKHECFIYCLVRIVFILCHIPYLVEDIKRKHGGFNLIIWLGKPPAYIANMKMLLRDRNAVRIYAITLRAAKYIILIVEVRAVVYDYLHRL